MSRFIRSAAIAAVAAACTATVAIAATATAASKGKKTSGVVYAGLTHTVGKTEFAAGNVSDKVLGNGAVTFELSLSAGSGGSIAGKGAVQVFTKTGELTGTDSVAIVTSSTGAVTFSNGKLNLTKGYGLEKGHSFVGTFTGSATSITGPFTFREKGTYK